MPIHCEGLCFIFYIPSSYAVWCGNDEDAGNNGNTCRPENCCLPANHLVYSQTLCLLDNAGNVITITHETLFNSWNLPSFTTETDYKTQLPFMMCLEFGNNSHVLQIS